MTKHLTIALAAMLLLFASCKKEQSVGKGTFSGTVEKQEAGGAKTHFVPGESNQLNVVWDEGDAVTLFSNKDTNGKKYTLTDGAGTGSGQFSGDEIDNTASQYVCFYPAGSAHYVPSSKGMIFSCTLPAEQTYVKESDGYFTKGTNLAVSYSTTAPSRTNPAKFKNLLGGLCLSLYSTEQGKVDKIVLTDNNTNLHGTATFDASSDNPSLTVSTPGENPHTITLNCGGVELGDAEHPTKFYFLLPVGSLSNGFTVNVYQTGIAEPVTTMTTTSGAATIARSTINAVPEHEVEYQFVHVPIEGELTGDFTVDGGGTKVHFSKSNLRWENGSFMFTDNQYDMLRSGNVMNQSGPIDLFGWGTSGYQYDGHQTYYQPWSCTDPTVTGYGISTISYVMAGNHDWGYNKIVKGGSKEGCWRTLTKEEFDYVLGGRNFERRWAKVQVCGVDGLIIVPDNFPNPLPGGAIAEGGINSMNYQTLCAYSIIKFDAINWKILEDNGCVFLPAAWWRDTAGYIVGDPSSIGCYWTATAENTGVSTCPQGAYVLQFRGDTGLSYQIIPGYRGWGSSVRLVRNCTKPSGK